MWTAMFMVNILLRTYSTNLLFFLLEKQDLSFSSVLLSPPIFHWFYEGESAKTSFKMFLQFDIAAAVRQFFTTNLCCCIFIGPRVCKEYYGIEWQFTSLVPFHNPVATWQSLPLQLSCVSLTCRDISWLASQ